MGAIWPRRQSKEIMEQVCLRERQYDYIEQRGESVWVCMRHKRGREEELMGYLSQGGRHD